MNLSNYHVKFVTVITHLFPILHSHTPQYYLENKKVLFRSAEEIGKKWPRMDKI